MTRLWEADILHNRMWSLSNPRIQGAIICMVIAVVYVFIWPGRKDPEGFRQKPLWIQIVLRWFHSLTWVLIALATLIWSKVPAAAAFFVYLIFILTMARERNTFRR